MKKFVVIVSILVLAMGLAACSSGNGSTGTNSSDNSSSTSSGTSASSSSTQSNYYFKDNVAETEDVKIVITDYKVIQPGETGNEYGDQPVIAFWYDTTNKSGKEVSPMIAWMAIFTAYQDTNPNQVNKLNVGMLPDSAFSDTQLEDIKQGGTASNAMSYELDDTSTPVVLKATKGLAGADLGEQEYSLL